MSHASAKRKRAFNDADDEDEKPRSKVNDRKKATVASKAVKPVQQKKKRGVAPQKYVSTSESDASFEDDGVAINDSDVDSDVSDGSDLPDDEMDLDDAPQRSKPKRPSVRSSDDDADAGDDVGAAAMDVDVDAESEQDGQANGNADGNEDSLNL